MLFNRLQFKFYLTEKNAFLTATKLGITNKIFVAATKNFAAATNTEKKTLLPQQNVLLI